MDLNDKKKHLIDNTKAHNPKKEYKCDDCSMTFDRLEKLEHHDHYIAKHAEDVPYVTYRLVDAESPLGAMVLSHPTEDAIEVCLSEKIAISGLFPCFDIPPALVKNPQALALYRSVGNTCGIATYSKVRQYFIS